MAANQDIPADASTKGVGSTIASMLGPLGAKRGSDGRFTTLQVWLKVAVIVLYVAFATVWLPSYLMEPNSLAVVRDLLSGLMSSSAWDTIVSLIVSGVWFGALAVALIGLRFAQKDRYI